METNEIERWLDGFSAFVPNDGRLTSEIIERVGPPPLDKPRKGSNPKDAFYDKIASIGRVRGFARVVLETKCAILSSQAYEYEKAGDLGKASEIDKQVSYWQSVAQYIEGL